MRVWGTDPWEKLRRSAGLATSLGASTVVVHPPFAWQRDYATRFGTGLRELRDRFPGIDFAVENMYPVRIRGREFVPYLPGWDVTRFRYDAYTLDISHCAASRSDPLAMADAMGSSLRHVHLGDGTGEGRDEHLVPGRGRMPCGSLLASLATRGFTGSVAVEVSTRRAKSRQARMDDLAEALSFAREHLGQAAPTPR
jgi:sugar phosphate isomerase/epimerase